MNYEMRWCCENICHGVFKIKIKIKTTRHSRRLMIYKGSPSLCQWSFCKFPDHLVAHLVSRHCHLNLSSWSLSLESSRCGTAWVFCSQPIFQRLGYCRKFTGKGGNSLRQARYRGGRLLIIQVLVRQLVRISKVLVFCDKGAYIDNRCRIQVILSLRLLRDVIAWKASRLYHDGSEILTSGWQSQSKRTTKSWLQSR